MTVVDTIFKAMSNAIPDRTIAAHHADLVMALLHGISPRDGELFIGFVGPTGGGWGAKYNEDGMSGVVCSNDGDTHNSPCEQLESKYPILVERHALRVDSGGAGKFRGGLGTEVVVRALSPMYVNVDSDRMHCAPWGLHGGLDGMGNRVSVRLDGEEVINANSKVRNVLLKTGDAFMLRGGGGGGFGPPVERDPELVARDVREGYVSDKVARHVYGVALNRLGNVDLETTGRLRSSETADASA